MIKFIKTILNIIGFIGPIIVAVYTKKWFILFAVFFYMVGVFCGVIITLEKVNKDLTFKSYRCKI